MKGKPKFKYDDKVQFTLSDGITRQGRIFIIDAYGTWQDPTDVSYDIMIETETGGKMLYKHITECLVSEV